MSDRPRLLIAAAPLLAAELCEQFEALGGFELARAASREALFEAAPNAEIILIDDTVVAVEKEPLLSALQQTGALIVLISNENDCHCGVAAQVTRPFRFMDLIAQIAAAQIAAPHEIDARLTEKEAAIFDRLSRAQGAIVSKATLLADVWGYAPNVSTRTLETHIHRLRQKIENNPSHPQKLLTAEGGYRLAQEKCAG